MNWKIFKFRSFISKKQEGFVVMVDQQLPETVLEDILFQLFYPFFDDLLCPQIYYFSSTDQILSYNEIIQAKDQLISTLELSLWFRAQQLVIQIIQQQASNSMELISTYLAKPVHVEIVQRKIQDLEKLMHLKEIKYEQYMKELQTLTDNVDILMLRDELSETLKEFQNKVKEVDRRAKRYSLAKKTLQTILNQSGISIRNIKDLF